jgi:hypothetical protein
LTLSIDVGKEDRRSTAEGLASEESVDEVARMTPLGGTRHDGDLGTVHVHFPVADFIKPSPYQ